MHDARGGNRLGLSLGINFCRINRTRERIRVISFICLSLFFLIESFALFHLENHKQVSLGINVTSCSLPKVPSKSLHRNRSL